MVHWTTAVVGLAAGLSAVVTAAPTASEKRQLPLPGPTYDFIVVGCGTSGAALAARLAESPGVTVACIEAGDGSSAINPLTFIPGADVLGVGAAEPAQPLNDWGYTTVPQAGAAGRSINYSRGKGIGGSSLKNFMIYQRPSAGSFLSWVAATSSQPSPGWSWRDVYPYFTKSAVLSPPDNVSRGPQYAPRYNPAAYPETDPTKAPLSLAYPNYAFEYSGTLQSAFTELGYPNASDFNSGTLNGVDYDTATIRHSDGHRASSQQFIDNAAALGRTNLQVITNALARKINFDSNKNAVSVTYSQLGGLSQTTITARKEIIVSGGAFNSPQLLMLSGVGPRDQLTQFGIPVVSELPGVGQGMQDHIFFSPGYEIDPAIYQFGHESQLLNLLISGGSVLFANQGSLTNNVADFLGWQRLNSTFFQQHPEASRLQSYPADWPHIEYLAAAGLTSTFQNLLLQNTIPANLQNKFFYSLLGAIVAPLSRGTVTLASADPTVKPNIDPRWLTDPGDQAVAVEIYRKIRRLFNTNAFKGVRANDQEYYPGYDQDSDAQVLAVIQQSLLTVWHAASTCAMKPRAQGGVLDPYLRVYGVQRLRVVDASAFPMLPPGHPQSTCYMLAERAADLIKQANGLPTNTVPRTPPQGDSGPLYSGPN